MRLFFLIVLLYYLTQILVDIFVISDQVIYNSFITQLSHDRISEILNQGNEWRWLTYVFIPVMLFFRILFVAICFSIGGLLLNLEIEFKKFFFVANTAEFVFLIPKIVKIFWFTIVETSYTLQDIQAFAPLSFMTFLSPVELDTWLVYPIRLLNVFEVFYWVVLAYQLKEVIGKNLLASIGFVAKTYGVGLFVWVVLVMFLVVSSS